MWINDKGERVERLGPDERERLNGNLNAEIERLLRRRWKHVVPVEDQGPSPR